MRRPLLISGFMATGKSTVGRLVAERTRRRYFDLDEVVEARAGRTVAELFSERGEPEFRRLEREALDGLLSDHADEGVVVSLGGGALLKRLFRVEVLGRAVVVSLTASPEEIARRALGQGTNHRPLLAEGDPEDRIRVLLQQRELAYQECHGRVATEERTPAQVADEVLSIWQRDAVAVAAGESSYTVSIGSSLIEEELADRVGAPSSALMVTDQTVDQLHGERVRAVLRKAQYSFGQVVLTPGEEHKNLEGLERIYQGAFERSVDRKATFVGFGGGVVTDMTGFAAATWVRGVSWVAVPTTLLSMVDASVGGKTAVDFGTAKNSVGAFWQPKGVICDVDTLKTEEDRMFIGALSEVVKTALIGDPALFELLEDRVDAIVARDPETIRDVVARCVRVKARVVGLDEREQGIRATLNLGHTVGHALESAGGFEALTHGEAVSLGLVAALRLGQRRGLTPPDLAARTIRLGERLGLPICLKREALTNAAELMSHDKKRAGDEIRFVFVHDLGDVRTEQVALEELIRVAPELAD